MLKMTRASQTNRLSGLFSKQGCRWNKLQTRTGRPRYVLLNMCHTSPHSGHQYRWRHFRGSKHVGNGRVTVRWPDILGLGYDLLEKRTCFDNPGRRVGRISGSDCAAQDLKPDQKRTATRHRSRLRPENNDAQLANASRQLV